VSITANSAIFISFKQFQKPGLKDNYRFNIQNSCILSKYEMNYIPLA